MKIGKCGNSLAVRIPAAIAKKLNLNPGDEIQMTVTGGHKFEVCKIEEPEPEEISLSKRKEALEQIRKMRIPLSDGYVFHRSEIYKL